MSQLQTRAKGTRGQAEGGRAREPSGEGVEITKGLAHHCKNFDFASAFKPAWSISSSAGWYWHFISAPHFLVLNLTAPHCRCWATLGFSTVRALDPLVSTL